MREGREGTLTIAVDGADLASVHIPRIIRMMGSTGVDVGCDRLSTVVDDYEAPFSFTGTIPRITFQIQGQRDRGDVASTARAESAKS